MAPTIIIAIRQFLEESGDGIQKTFSVVGCAFLAKVLKLEVRSVCSESSQ
jgi:hypothetical protein